MSGYSIPPLLSLICFSGLLLMTLVRRRMTRTGGLFMIMCGMGILLNLDMIAGFESASAERVLTISRRTHLVLVFAIPVYVQFFHAFLSIHHRRWLEMVAYGYAIGLMAVSQSPLYLTGVHRYGFGMVARSGPLYPFFGIGGLTATVYVLVLLYRAIDREPRSLQKNRLRYVWIGFAWMGFLYGLNSLPRLGLPLYPPGNLSCAPLLVFAVGLFRYDLLDMGLVIRKVMLYGILGGILAGLVVLIAALGRHAGTPTSLESGYPAVLLIAAVVVLGPLKETVRRRVDRLFSRDPIDYAAHLKALSKTIVSLLDPMAIGRQVTTTLIESMQLRAAALLVHQESDGKMRLLAAGGDWRGTHQKVPLPAAYLVTEAMGRKGLLRRQQLLESASQPTDARVLSEMDRLGVEVALPFGTEGGSSGLLLLGEKRSGSLYFSEDIDLLETLTGQAALALDNARHHSMVVELTRHLEQKVADRTRELRAALAETERTQEQLIQSESLAAIGQLVAGVAHELNNPLASIKSLLQSAIEDLAALGNGRIDPLMLEDLRLADTELTRAHSIVTSLLALSRQTQTYTEAVCLNDCIIDAVRILRNQYKTGRPAVITELATGLPTVRGNFAQLGQVALNMFRNAIHAAGQADGEIGMVRLTTGVDATGDAVVFTCEDSGPGVADACRHDIFKPFFTTKPVGQGTGLGLYICHDIVRRHGGTLMLDNPGQSGARFVVRLPVASERSLR